MIDEVVEAAVRGDRATLVALASVADPPALPAAVPQACPKAVLPVSQLEAHLDQLLTSTVVATPSPDQARLRLYAVVRAPAGEGLEGRVGARLDDEEVFLEPGDLLFKPRGQWHTFWNAGDVPARILEIICPAGLEELFRELDAASEPPDPEAVAALAARYGAQVAFDRTLPIVEQHDLAF